MDALEWGCRDIPEECGAFLQVSGMTYEIDAEVGSPCRKDAAGMFAGVEGARRVQNVTIGGEPLDPEKKYTLASIDYMLFKHGDGFTMFDGAPVVLEGIKLDNQVLIDYITDTLGGTVGSEYADPLGQGRITYMDAGETAKQAA